MIKILFCIDGLVRGGTELQLIELINRLDRDVYKPYLLTIRETDLSLTPRDCVHLDWQVPSLFSLGGVKAVLQLKSFLKEEGIDVVQTFFQDSTLLTGFASWLAGTPVRLACFRDMGFWQSRLVTLAMKAVCKTSTAYVCNAEQVRQHFIKQLGLNPNKALVIRNGFAFAHDVLPECSDSVRDIVLVGNMTRQVKRVDLFVEAAALLANSNPDVTWHVIGDGHLRSELESLAERRKVLDRIKFVGRVADVSSYLKTMDVGVICSDSEGLSNALIEYMASGVAAIATEVGGNVELIDSMQTGLLIRSDDPRALADAMQLMIDDQELRASMRLAARKHIEDHYSWEKCLAAYQQVHRGEVL